VQLCGAVQHGSTATSASSRQQGRPTPHRANWDDSQTPSGAASSKRRGRHARCVPDRKSARGQSQSLAVKPARFPQATESPGRRRAAPQTSQADSTGSSPGADCQTSSTTGSHAGSHTDERHLDSPDFHRQPTGTRPRSRTDLNGSGRLHMEGRKHAGGRVGGLPRTRRRRLHDSRNLSWAPAASLRDRLRRP